MRRTLRFVLVAGIGLAAASTVRGEINLELRPPTQTAGIGETVRLGLYAVSDSDEVQSMSAADVILGWDPAYLQLLGNDDTGAVPLLVSGFPVTDPYGLNEEVPPQDGDGFYLAYAPLGRPVEATPEGTLLTTFLFDALEATEGTVVEILESAGSPVGHTVVYDGEVPGLDVTGTLGTATVVIRECRHGDFDGDGHVDLADFAAFQWCYAGVDESEIDVCVCVFDFVPDAIIDLADYAEFASRITGPAAGP